MGKKYHKAMSFDELNEFRRNEGLPLIVKSNIRCMCCSKQFESEDIKKIRICYPCKKNEGGGINICSIDL